MLFVTNKFISCILIVLLVSCSSAAREELPLARVYDKYLYPSDIEGVVPDEVTGADSVQIIRSYIDNWVRQAVILNKAERNIAVNEAALQRQVDDYRNSLLIYHYEQALVNERMDTAITEEELRAYYDDQMQNFLLSKNIYQVAYAELGANAPGLLEVKKQLLNPSPEEVGEDRKSTRLNSSH